MWIAAFVRAAWAFEGVGPQGAVPVVVDHVPKGLASFGQEDLALADAAAAWTDPGCASFSFALARVAGPVVQAVDQRNVVVFGDPYQQLEAGVLATTYAIGYGPVLAEADIIVADDVTWVTDADAADPACTDAYSLQAVLTHELGHVLGLGHSDDADATMYAPLALSASPCDPGASTIEADDVAGVEFLYADTLPVPVCSAPDGAQLLGGAPLEVVCGRSDAEIEIAGASWDFGDGTVLTTPEATHVYGEPGTFALTGGFTYPNDCERPPFVHDVVVCDLPEAGMRIEEREEGGFVLRNETPIPTVGCLTSVEWEMVNGELRDTSPEWEPTVGLSTPGTWTVTLTVSGPAGAATAEGTVDVKPPGCGCRSAPSTGLVLVPALLALIRRRSRRRTS